MPDSDVIKQALLQEIGQPTFDAWQRSEVDINDLPNRAFDLAFDYLATLDEERANSCCECGKPGHTCHTCPVFTTPPL